MYRLRLMCMDDGLHKEGDIIDGIDMMEAYGNTVKVYRKYCIVWIQMQVIMQGKQHICMSLWKG